MINIIFVTGNQKKADYLAQYFGHPIDHVKIDLDEIQSLDLQKIVRHKVHQAFEKVKQPVLVEDVSLEFSALGKLPGTFIKWFIGELSLEGTCSLLNGKERDATARCIFGYYDGNEEAYFEGKLSGKIAEKPSGTGGYGWDSIFIPNGYSITRAELSKEDDEKTYLQIKPLEQVKKFLGTKN